MSELTPQHVLADLFAEEFFEIAEPARPEHRTTGEVKIE